MLENLKKQLNEEYDATQEKNNSLKREIQDNDDSIQEKMQGRVKDMKELI